MSATWPEDLHRIAGACREVPSPGLLVRPNAVAANIDRMIALAGDPGRLRPHLKTTKSPEVVRLLLNAGVRQFKCATLAEMAMAFQAGAMDVLLAYQPVGPQLGLLAALAKQYPEATLSVLVDCVEAADAVNRLGQAENITTKVFIDIDCGMHRTGLPSGDLALALLRAIESMDHLSFQGWHVYDGHLRQTDLEERRHAVAQCFAPVWEMIATGDSEAPVIAGGMPSFPVHAADPRVVCSPGTLIYWDAGYATICPDMQFDFAALLLTRVISRSDGHLTLDLGHKAVAAENPIDRRVVLPAIPDAEFVEQSEEHLVLRTASADRWPVGAPLIGIPWHVCPSVALHDHATLIDSVGRIDGRWEIPARRRDVPV